MYQGYGLQIRVSADGDQSNGGSVFFKSKKQFSECTVEDFESLIGAVEFVPCKCGGSRLMGSREDERCEKCFLGDLDREISKEMKKEAEQNKKADEKQKKMGFKWKVEAYIHPKRGGDDYRAIYYFLDEPTNQDIQLMLAGVSNVTTDYGRPTLL
jgi:hypothetical protein